MANPPRDPAANTGYLGTTAPQIAAQTWKRRVLVERPAELRAVAATLTNARILAIDAEFVTARLHAPSQPSHKLALLQFAMDDNCGDSFVVDALRLPDLDPLRDALEDPGILKLFHGISADARMLATRGLEARHILDLEAVSRSIFGQRESGLQAMLIRATGVRMDKSLQRADWSRRPLTPAMVAYAARDAEMTLVLSSWLTAHYPWAVAVHEVAADEPAPAIAPWLLPYVDGSRTRPIELAVAEAGLNGNVAAQERDIRDALGIVRHPGQRARVMRSASDLSLTGLVPDVVPFTRALPSDERAGAARALGRLRAYGAMPELQALQQDPVFDVRQAAENALAQMAEPHPDRQRHYQRSSLGVWTVSGPSEEAPAASDDWRAALRARFGVSSSEDEA